MKSIRRQLIVLLVIAFGPLVPTSAEPATESPDAVVNALYHSSMKNFGFSPDAVKATKPWVTPELYKRMWKKVNQPVPKGDAPDIEGDLFLNCQDAPTKLTVGKATINGTKAQVEVALAFGDEKRKYTVLLEQVGGAWKVSDVNYGKDGKLTDLL